MTTWANLISLCILHNQICVHQLTISAYFALQKHLNDLYFFKWILMSQIVFTEVYDITHISGRKNRWKGEEHANQMVKNILRKKTSHTENWNIILQSQKGKIQFKTVVTQPFTSKPHLYQQHYGEHRGNYCSCASGFL